MSYLRPWIFLAKAIFSHSLVVAYVNQSTDHVVALALQIIAPRSQPKASEQSQGFRRCKTRSGTEVIKYLIVLAHGGLKMEENRSAGIPAVPLRRVPQTSVLSSRSH